MNPHTSLRQPSLHASTSGLQLSYTLSEAASHIVRRIPELLRRLRDLENEEVELDTKARQLVGQPPVTEQQRRSSTPSRPTISTPVSKLRDRTTTAVGMTSTPPHVDPSIHPFVDLETFYSTNLTESIETPVKTFLLMQSFALAMSVKSKRKGRIFMTGDSTEFGEKI